MKPEVAKDLIELVNSMKAFAKNKTVKYGQTSFDYVPLDDLLERVKNSDKFACMQPLSLDENGNTCIETILVHMSGEEVKSGKFPLHLNQSKAQDIGAMITYMKRYTLGAFLGIATETDNDANFESDVTPKKVSNKTLTLLQSLIDEEEKAKTLGYYKIKKLSDLTEEIATKLVNKKLNDKKEVIKQDEPDVQEALNIDEL